MEELQSSTQSKEIKALPEINQTVGANRGGDRGDSAVEEASTAVELFSQSISCNWLCICASVFVTGKSETSSIQIISFAE